MNTITIREYGSKYLVFDGDLLLACFGSKAAAQEYEQMNSRKNDAQQTAKA